MRRLPLISIAVFIAIIIIQAFRLTDSPHGDSLDVECSVCHHANGWNIDTAFYKFDHSTTFFPLTGQHQTYYCRGCHPTLVFSEAGTECIDCHSDMHQETVGIDCGRCHNTQSWLVHNVGEIHQLSRFPLTGPHLAAACSDCHISASSLRFEELGVECVDCHLNDYQSASSPNHIEANYSTDCLECHNMFAFTWAGAGINHDFFPLTGGHEINECYKCHTPGTEYSNISTDCFSCHEDDYNNSVNPSHLGADFSLVCNECHTTNPGWKPAEFYAHDGLYFPVYSGEHAGEWNSCNECHPDPSNYVTFTCIDCHEHNQPDMDEEHEGIQGYLYESPECLACHPTGSAEEGFDHSLSDFPLTGAHIEVNCMDCHLSGYSNTPTACFSCHEPDFNESTNPNHVNLTLAIECQHCHTTDPDWQPATFDIHNDYFALNFAHAEIQNNCFDCHEGDYTNTPNSCAGCHIQDYNNSLNPNHVDLSLSNECQLCHTERPGWTPATFDVHNDYYPLNFAHAEIQGNCIECHKDGYANTPNTCVGCHQQDYNNSLNPNHSDLGLSNDCQLCHTERPDWMPATFDVHNDYYSLNGAHALIANNCNDCHQGDYNNTPITCFGCHQDDFNQTTDPDHEASQFSIDCLLCHTEVAWEPSTFDHDNQYFPIYSGSHNGEWNNCIECHTNPSNYAIFSCIDCHEHNQPDMDDEHSDVPDYVYNSIACLDCHPDGESMPIRIFRTPDNFNIDDR